MAQCFYAYRIRILSNRLVLPIIGWCGAVIRIALCVTLGISFSQSQTIPDFLAQRLWLVETPLAVNVTLDVMNTASLCYYLRQRRHGFVS
jgi:hypothetical protein